MAKKTIPHAQRFAAVTETATYYYNFGVRDAHIRSGLQYETGPRFGQQLAVIRRANRNLRNAVLGAAS
jgi:hypothetical protein